jgi:hypothetical protein
MTFCFLSQMDKKVGEHCQLVREAGIVAAGAL